MNGFRCFSVSFQVPAKLNALEITGVLEVTS